MREDDEVAGRLIPNTDPDLEPLKEDVDVIEVVDPFAEVVDPVRTFV